MANVVRSDLLENRTSWLVKANASRREGEMMRLLGNRPGFDLVMCLGAGRCQFPADGDSDGKRFCPFCFYYTEARTHDDTHAKRAAQHFVKGH